MPKKNESEKKKKKRGMSTKNLKEHRSFYKWIKYYGAILIEMKRRIDEMEARLDSLLEDLEKKQ